MGHLHQRCTFHLEPKPDSVSHDAFLKRNHDCSESCLGESCADLCIMRMIQSNHGNDSHSNQRDANRIDANSVVGILGNKILVSIFSLPQELRLYES